MASVSKFTTGTQGSLYTRNLTSQLQIEEIGNWRALSLSINKLPTRIRKMAIDAIEDYGIKYYRKVILTIDKNGQNLPNPWAPLSPIYSAYKSKRGGQSGIYKWTGTLRGAIGINRLDTGQVTIGVDKNARGSRGDSPLSASQIAHILQNGSLTRHIPPRPLFGPVWKMMGGNRGLATFVKKQFVTKGKDHLLNIKT